MQNKGILIVVFSIISLISRGQNDAVILDYINTYKELAIIEMQRSGVPAAIKLAQGIHETMAGTSDLVAKSNNHFGIKCKDTWTGASVTHDDDLRGECFRKYNSAEASYRDHSDFLKNSSRYSSLFQLDPTDYEGWANGLKKAGYATNPRYSEVIIKLIEDYHLENYTLIALGKLPSSGDLVNVSKVLTEEKTRNTGPVITAEKNEEPRDAWAKLPNPTPLMSPPNKEEPPTFVKIQETLATETKDAWGTVKPKVQEAIHEQVYPGGEFRLNETRVIYAKKGTSFLAIAEQYSVPLARVFEFNDMPEAEMVNLDQLIYLQRKRKTGYHEYHVVRPGESLHDIAQEEALRIESLLEYNLLKLDMKPAIGEQLSLQSKAAQPPKLLLKEIYSIASVPPPSAIVPEANGRLFNCTVRPKETIYAIAKKYSVKIEEIVKWNQLRTYDLRPGQRLKIYK